MFNLRSNCCLFRGPTPSSGRRPGSRSAGYALFPALFGVLDGPLAPYARFGGVMLISSGVVAAGSRVFALCDRIARRSTFLAGVVQCATVPIVIGIGAIGSALIRQRDGAGFATGLTVAAVQANLPRIGLDFAQRRALLASALLRMLSDYVRRGARAR